MREALVLNSLMGREAAWIGPTAPNQRDRVFMYDDFGDRAERLIGEYPDDYYHNNDRCDDHDIRQACGLFLFFLGGLWHCV